MRGRGRGRVRGRIRGRGRGRGRGRRGVGRGVRGRGRRGVRVMVGAACTTRPASLRVAKRSGFGPGLGLG